MNVRRFPIVVLGSVSVEFPEARKQGNLSRAKQRTLAALVAAHDTPVDWSAMSEQAGENLSEDAIGKAKSAFRMAISRLRAHLPENAIIDLPEEGDRLDLDTFQVDVWRLLELSGNRSPLSQVEPAELLHLLNPVPPFGGIEDLELVESMSRRIRNAQRDLFSRLPAERPDLLRGELLEHLRQHLDEDPYNETLLALLVVAEAETGNRRRGIELLQDAKRQFNEVGLDLAPQLAELELDLLDGNVSPRFVPYVSSRQLELPGVLESVRVGPHVGHDDELGELAALIAPGFGYRAAIVSGRKGVGKTRLCAELATMAVKRGVPSLCLSPTRIGSDAAFGPLLTALASLRERATEIFDRHNGADIQRAQLWTAALDALVAKAGPGRLLLIIDDSERLDVQTTDLISHLPMSELASRLALVVVTEPGARSSESLAITIGSQPSALSIDLDVLDEHAMRALVSSRDPELDDRLVQNLARHLYRLSDGLVGVATVVLANLDDLHLIPGAHTLRGDRLIESIVANLPAEDFEVGLTASVIGLDFDLDALQAISAQGPNELLSAVNRLIERELAREGRTDVDFAIAHVLVQSAFISQAETDQLLHLHQAAAKYWNGDIHRRARHQAMAFPLVDETTAVASLLESAELYLDRGAYRAAVDHYRQAQVVSGRRLPTGHEGRFARALELAGLPLAGRRVRDKAFNDALHANDHGLALIVAISGLPEGEPIDGDRDLVNNLLELDPSSLDHDCAHAHACHLARQLTIVGRLDDAVLAAARAKRVAKGPDQEIKAAIAARFAISATSTPVQRLAKMEAVESRLDEVPPALQADYCAHRVIDHYEWLEAEESRRWRRRIDEIAAPLPPIRHWHARLFDAMIMTDTGDAAEAEALRTAAYEFALNAGISEAANARLAPGLIDIWLAGKMETCADLVGPGRPLDPEGSVLSRAGASLALDAVGRKEEAIRVAELLAADIVRSPASQGTAALALVTSVLANSSDQRLVATVRSMLDSRGRSFLIVGACVASLGPTDRYRAELANSTEEARRHRLTAVELARDSGSLLWEAVTCRDLVVHHGDEAARAQLIDLTENSDLEHLVPDD